MRSWPLAERTRFFLELVVSTGAAIVAAKALKITVDYARAYNPAVASSTSGVFASSLTVALHSWALGSITVALAGVALATLPLGRRIVASLRPRRWWLAPLTVVVLLVGWRLAAGGTEGQSFAGDSSSLQRLVALAPKIESRLRANGALFYQDAIVIVTFALVGLGTAVAAPDRFARTARGVLIAISVGVCFITGLELAQFSKTGIPGSGHLLGYTVANFAGLWTILRDSIDVVTLGALTVPFIVWLVARWATRRWYAYAPANGLPRAASYCAMTLLPGLVILAVNPKLENGADARLTANGVMGLSDLMGGRSNRELNAQLAADELPLLFSTGGLTAHRATSGASQRNLVVIMLESTRSAATSLYPPYPATTPAMTWLAKNGATVDEMYAVAPVTTSAWISILYGVWPSTTEITSDWGGARERGHHLTSLAAILHSAGYATGFVTPTNLKVLDDGVILRKMGFDWLVGSDSLNPSNPPQGYLGLADRGTVAPALGWIDSQVKSRRPFFLTMMTAAAHHPYRVPAGWTKRTFDEKASVQYNDYLNCVAYTDSVVREFLSELDERGILDSTVVVVLGDHGEAFGEHGEKVHGSLLYNETVHVPAVIFARNRVAPGTRIGGLRQQIDVVPTVLELLGLALEGGSYPGLSMLHDAPPDRELFFTSASFGSELAARTGPLKFHFFLDRNPTQVFNVLDDPGETKDLSRTMAPGEVAATEERMLLWRARVMRSLLSP